MRVQFLQENPTMTTLAILSMLTFGAIDMQCLEECNSEGTHTHFWCARYCSE